MMKNQPLYHSVRSALLSLFLVAMSTLTSFSQNGLLAEYYDGQNFDRFVSSMYVDKIDDDWWGEPPVPGVDPQVCSIRWTGKLKPGKSAQYLFSARVDDGIRVWIDGELIINQWHLNDVGVFAGATTLVANQEYDLKVEYFNALNEGEVRLLWAMEKSKDEQSWYERLFGVTYNYEVISSNFFIRPEKPLPTMKEVLPPKKNKTSEASPTTERKTLIPQPVESKVDIIAQEPMTVERAEKYIPKNIEFVRAKAEILEVSNRELDIFAQFMLDHPDVTVLIEGHTDVVGNEEANLKLSKQRANKVARYLVKKGVSGLRIKTEGYGSSRPIKMPEEGGYYPPNRRVVFVLSGLGE